ncbi:putative 21.2 kDa protein [Colletotrichum chlorophyti]|uniref:Putative 21.2 kDa protein n=1 Tax=Colletotrichum chlorophyti TaxID=708187 RepID=A0A1Q8S3K4_9PEZI|nr:putative 21.2 kDa protein [Colletotrichum chlorophyti]
MATNPPLYTYPSPLEEFENAPELPQELALDGKSFKNPPREGLSKSYEEFTDPLDKGRRGGFDVHVYHFQNNPEQVKHARDLWERIRREFPELRIYKFWDRPVGPHPVAMFEVNLFTPAQFGAFIPWLNVYRGPLSVLIHPNSVEEGVDHNATEVRDHTQRAIWMGERLPLDLSILYG